MKVDVVRLQHWVHWWQSFASDHSKSRCAPYEHEPQEVAVKVHEEVGHDPGPSSDDEGLR